MNRGILGFAVLYGELTSAVILIVLAGLWVDAPSGQKFCGAVHLGSSGCKGVLSLFIFVAIGYAAYHSLKSLVSSSKNDDNSQKEVKK